MLWNVTDSADNWNADPFESADWNSDLFDDERMQNGGESHRDITPTSGFNDKLVVLETDDFDISTEYDTNDFLIGWPLDRYIAILVTEILYGLCFIHLFFRSNVKSMV